MIKLEHRFVEFIPKEIEDGVLYISIRFTTAVHKCACGCGIKTFTPLSPTDWRLLFNGKSVTLDPSIGNWGFPCKSHYWIIENKILWSKMWNDVEIYEGRKQNKLRKQDYYKKSDRKRRSKKKKKSPWWKLYL